METLIGRIKEKQILTTALNSGEPELIAVYGRRRVGKTFLIRSIYKDNIIFEFSGVHSATMNDQLQNFANAMQTTTGSAVPLAVAPNWIQSFFQLQAMLTPQLKKGRSVIFFDEFPWAHTPKSGFLEAFDHFWNSWCTKQDNLVVVICGSAAAWIIRNIVNNKGGLHNRISQKIRLLPFNLSETELYLKSRRINIDRYQVLQIYMAMGGIPQYLKSIKPGQSAAMSIEELCFSTNGFLKGEFNNLYQSLFDKAENHIIVIKALAAKGKGLTRNEIIDTCNLSSGGTTTKLLEELVESGFITPYIPFNKNVKESIYKLTDEYSVFYLKFMSSRASKAEDAWLKISAGSSWKTWSGFAFESICLKHTQQIKSALGIAAVSTEESVWRYTPGNGEQGAQIDLLIDRQDGCINICEMKYSSSEFTIDKAYVVELKRKLDVFKTRAKTRKSLFLTMITTHGAKQNDNYLTVVQKQLTMNSLFT